MIRRLSQSFAAGLLAVVLALPLQAKPLQLGVDAMRQLAFQTVQAGYAQDGLRLTDALLARYPKDATALIIRSQALRSLGRLAEAQKAAKTAWSCLLYTSRCV